MSAWFRKAKGGVIAFIGYVLSPLSWWNDTFVNIPLAYLFAVIVGIFFKNLFEISVIVGYWLTNIIGLLMMHYGASEAVLERKMTKKELAVNVAFSLAYTMVMAYLIHIGILKFPTDYFRK